MRRALLLLALVVGCSGAGAAVRDARTALAGAEALEHLAKGQTLDVAGTDQAVALVWAFYGRTDAPPRVLWVAPGDLDCDGGEGFTSVGLDPRGRSVESVCVSGQTLVPWAVSVARHPGRALHRESLAHELRHAADLRRLVFDQDHLSPAWLGLAACGCLGPTVDCAVVDRANELLFRSGW